MLQKHLYRMKFIWKQMAAASEFPWKLSWTVISTEHVKNIITALHLILWQGFNKYIIRTASSRLQSEDPQMTCQQTSHSLFTDAYCTQEPAEITSSDSDLIKQCCACSLIIWNKDILCFHNEIEISKQNCVWFFFSEFCEIIFYTLFNTDKQCSVLVLIKFFMPHYYVFDKILKVTLDHKT